MFNDDDNNDNNLCFTSFWWQFDLNHFNRATALNDLLFHKQTVTENVHEGKCQNRKDNLLIRYFFFFKYVKAFLYTIHILYIIFIVVQEIIYVWESTHAFYMSNICRIIFFQVDLFHSHHRNQFFIRLIQIEKKKKNSICFRNFSQCRSWKE